MEILPQTTQENEKIYLLDENIAICQNGKILYYDILGHLHDTNYECVVNNIIQDTNPNIIKQKIINLESIMIDFFIIDLVHNTINNYPFTFVNNGVIEYKGFLINLDTLEVAKPQELKADNEMEAYLEAKEVNYNFDEETQKAIKTIILAIYREQIDNFVDYQEMVKYLDSKHSIL
ncbi:hypothetical protein PWA69_001556 [Campylobacter coli]|nr:hypothetical protein [Campylobacter coli]